MLPLEQVLSILNQGKGYIPLYPFLGTWRNIYYRTSVHISGVCPSYCNLRYDAGRREWEGYSNVIQPAGWRSPAYDEIFENNLLNKFPRESDVIRQWRKSQYRPAQQAPFRQAIDKMEGTIFADSNYSIRVDNTEDNEYINGNNFAGKDLVGFISSRLQLICEDPNSIFVVMPDKPWYETDGEVRPQIYNIPTRNIVEVTDEEIIFYYLDFAWLVNNIGFFRFKQNGSVWENADGAYGGYYAHMLHRTPKHFAGGIWNTLGFYESYLNAGLPYADEYVGVKSDQQLVDKEASHPFIQATSTDCPACNKTGKERYCTSCRNEVNSCHCTGDSIERDLRRCSSCNGSGHIQSWNPAEWKIVPVADADVDHIKIINPDVGINKNHAERVRQVYLSLKEALHLWYIDQAQSGKAKEKDLEGQYIFMQKASDGLFDLIEKLLIDILSMRHTSTANGEYKAEIPDYVIVKPTQFALKTEYDLLDEYDIATKSGLPDFFKAVQLESLTDKLYGGNKAMLKKVNVITQMDPLAVTKEADKVIKVNAGAISRRAYQFSTELPGMLDSVIREMGADMFCMATYDEIKAKVDMLFKDIAPVEMQAENTTVKEVV